MHHPAHLALLAGPAMLFAGLVLMMVTLFSQFSLYTTVFLGIAILFGVGTVRGSWDEFKASSDLIGRAHGPQGER